jgi:hypothetical protein
VKADLYKGIGHELSHNGIIIYKQDQLLIRFKPWWDRKTTGPAEEGKLLRQDAILTRPLKAIGLQPAPLDPSLNRPKLNLAVRGDIMGG